MATDGLDRVAEVADRVARLPRDPILFRVQQTMARAYAEAALAGSDPDAEKLAEALVNRLLEQRAPLRPDGPVRTSLDDILAVAEAELARIRGTATPELWSSAVDAMRRQRREEPWLHARLRYAEALLAGDRADEALAELAPAYDRARSVGAIPIAEAMAALARRTRLKLPGLGRSQPDLESGLTSREREVLVLVARGRTNREIGAELYIADKTASVHVSNILAKLGVTNRAEAGAKARSLGLDETPETQTGD
jgi:DNA-binding CsgD family transcriptional regulator